MESGISGFKDLRISGIGAFEELEHLRNLGIGEFEDLAKRLSFWIRRLGAARDRRGRLIHMSYGLNSIIVFYFSIRTGR